VDQQSSAWKSVNYIHRAI